MNISLGFLLFLFNFVKGIPEGENEASPEHGARPPSKLADLRCSKISYCFYPPSNGDNDLSDGDDDKKLIGYCRNFPTRRVPTWERDEPVTLNTCCLPDKIDGSLGGWSQTSGNGYCYCCDGIGTTCGDSNCARFSAKKPNKWEEMGEDGLIYYNYSTVNVGGEKVEDYGGILFRKGKRIE